MNKTTERNKTEDQNLANTISEQIGGKALFMLGAKNKVWGVTEKGQVYISFRIRGSKLANYVKVIYDGVMDLYIMEFGKIHGFKYRVVNTVEGVYCDQLCKVIEENTKLYTRL